MTVPTQLRHMVDDDYRKRVTDLAEQMAAKMLEREIWRTQWKVEIDGCVFKFKVEGYPKYGSQRWKDREAENAELMREFEATSSH